MRSRFRAKKEESAF